jgi:hypothetical protein
MLNPFKIKVTMIKKLLFGVILALPFFSIGQARFIVNGAYVMLNGGTAVKPIYIEINNPAANAITRNSGWIVSESEFNMVKWDIGTNAGVYTLPWGYQTIDYIPLTVSILAAGAPLAGTIKFSTYHTTADNWTCCPPSDVTNMFPSIVALSQPTPTDDSWWVVDRFWIIDANTGYTTKPSPNLKFTYIDNGVGTEIAAPNVFAEPSLAAQRFNSTLGTWGDYLGTGGTVVATPPTGTCKNDPAVAITPAGFFRSWTLSSLTDPLPIQLTSFNANCDNGSALITWITQSELNNDHFTVERSPDGMTYQAIATVAGAGNSNTQRTYSVTDPEPLPGTSYYRLSQTDFDGKTIHFAPIAFSGCAGNGTTISAFGSYGNIVVRVDASNADEYTMTLTNLLGQVILDNVKSLPAGYTEFYLNPGILSNSIYILTIRTSKTVYSKKLVLGQL